MTTRGRIFPVEPLGPAEVEGLVSVCESDASVRGARDRAFVRVLFGCGLRCAEALALEVKDLDFEKGAVRVLRGKGQRMRVSGGLVNGTAQALKTHLTCSDIRSGLVFRTATGQPVHPSHYRRLLPQLARRAGIEKRVHPHGLRHSHAYHLADRKVPVHQIQRQLGHQSLVVTQRYIDHLNPQAVIDGVNGAMEW